MRGEHVVKQHGNDNGRAKLTAKQVQQLRDLWRLRPLTTQRGIAAHFGLSQSTVSDILAGRLWGHLPDVPGGGLTPAKVPAPNGRLLTPNGFYVVEGGAIAGELPRPSKPDAPRPTLVPPAAAPSPTPTPTKEPRHA